MQEVNWKLTPQTVRIAVSGQQDYEKGAAYERAGRVLAVEFEEILPGGGVFFGEVQGNQRRPYEVVVEVQRLADQQLLPTITECDCPLGGACKHVAATLISAMKQHSHDKQPSHQWHQQLASLVDHNAAPTGDGIALMWEVRKKRISTAWSWSGGAIQEEMLLVVKPVVRSATTNKWIKQGVTWRDVVHYGNTTVHQYGASSEQVRVLADFFNLFRVSRTDHDYDETEVRMNVFSAPLLWDMLERIRNLGIPCVTAARDQRPVVFHEPATIEAALSEDQKNDDLILATTIRSSGKTLPTTRRFIGDPPTGVYWWEAIGNLQQADIHVARLDAPLQLSQLAKEHGKVTIPSSEASQFLEDTYPKLSRRFALDTQKVKKRQLPAQESLCLVCDVGTKGQQIVVDFGFTYDATGKTVVPLEAAATTGRDIAQEQRIIQMFAALVQTEAPWFQQGALQPQVVLAGGAAVRFMNELLPRLKAHQDILVRVADSVPAFTELTGAPEIHYELNEHDDQTDWFNLGITITIDGQSVPFEPVFAALAENQELLVLEDSRYLSLHHPELEALRQLIAEARQLNETEGLGLSRYQAGLWEELQKLGVITHQAEAWDQAVRGLLDVQEMPEIAVPKALKATLRPYQYDGFRWMAFLWQHRLGGVLADDMGLGKTVQSIALLLHAKAQTKAAQQKPALIVAPTSVAANWAHELARFAPSLKVVSVQKTVPDSAALKRQIKRADVVVTSYALFRRNAAAYQAVAWNVLILDEAQFVKNHQSQSYQAARKLPAPCKLALTGTPLENNLMELWALLSIAAPGLFPSPKKFEEFYRKPIEKASDADKLAQLRQRVRPLMLRRTKEQVVKELPPKIEQILEVELTPEHRKVYDTFLQRERQKVLGLLGDMDKNRFLIFKSLTTLRQLSLAASLVDAKKYAKVPSAKLTELLERLQDLIAEGHRALVFSQFTGYLSLVREELEAAGIEYAYLDGSTRQRGDLLKQFKDGAAPVFIISLKAGGFGLNLTEADYCFLLDPWWNPAVEQQAVDRTHRIGQTNQVMVYRLVAKDTIEEKVMALKAKKAKLFTSMLDEGAAFSAQVTAEDIKTLFL